MHVPAVQQRTNRGGGKRAKLTFAVDDRPALDTFRLPGLRREVEGRGGAQATLEVMRYVIRCPLLPALVKALPARDYSKGGRPAEIPDIFWFFYTVISREMASAEAARETILTHWVEVAKEFYFEHGIQLPAEARFDHSGFDSWRKRNITERKDARLALEALLERFTRISAPLALAVRDAYAPSHQLDLMNPSTWDCLSGDGTVRNAPTDVRATEDDNGGTHLPGTRAKDKTRARAHSPQRPNTKDVGPKEGLHYVAITTQGDRYYTRTVLGLDIGDVREGEMTVADRVIDDVVAALGTKFSVFVYDGALLPTYFQRLIRKGLMPVNSNTARDRTSGNHPGEGSETDAATNRTGIKARPYGKYKTRPKKTYVTSLNPVKCSAGGASHVHDICGDDGSVYELATRLRPGASTVQTQTLRRESVERVLLDDGTFCFDVTFTGTCDRSPTPATFSTTQRVQALPRTGNDRERSVARRSVLANIRLLPDTDPRFAPTMGLRNQSESFFSWLERRYYFHDRAQSYERPAQRFDFLASALLHNSEVWAHLAVRHPDHATNLRGTLNKFQALTPDDLPVQPVIHDYGTPPEASQPSLFDELPEGPTTEPATPAAAPAAAPAPATTSGSAPTAKTPRQEVTHHTSSGDAAIAELSALLTFSDESTTGHPQEKP